ncbi:MAG: cyclophilin-like fold protein [Chloroflexia bacterium]
MARILIFAGDVALEAELNESPTAQQILVALPFEGEGNRWGDEIYFEIPVVAENEPTARVEMEIGEVAYWPAGRALCLFFGPTPVSRDDRPRAYSPVNVVGRILGDASVLRGVPDGCRVRVERAQGGGR